MIRYKISASDLHSHGDKDVAMKQNKKSTLAKHSSFLAGLQGNTYRKEQCFCIKSKSAN